MTEICDRTLRAAGPALLFERPTGFQIPVLGNLFGTPQRVALAMGATDVAALRDVGELLAALKEPEAPQGLRDALGKVAQLKSALWDMAPREVRIAPCQAVVWEGSDVDLGRLPIQTLLARRRRTADHLGPRCDARSPQKASKPRYLPATGAKSQQSDHALASTSRRRA